MVQMCLHLDVLLLELAEVLFTELQGVIAVDLHSSRHQREVFFKNRYLLAGQFSLNPKVSNDLVTLTFVAWSAVIQMIQLLIVVVVKMINYVR